MFIRENWKQYAAIVALSVLAIGIAVHFNDLCAWLTVTFQL